MSGTLDARTRLAIEMAATAGRTDPSLRARQDADARMLGMVGAEIDAARAGKSFDARIARALDLAMAPDDSGRARRRLLAAQAGFDESACREIERLADGWRAGAQDLLHQVE